MMFSQMISISAVLFVRNQLPAHIISAMENIDPSIHLHDWMRTGAKLELLFYATFEPYLLQLAAREEITQN